jgi:hypothetical protein
MTGPSPSLGASALEWLWQARAAKRARDRGDALAQRIDRLASAGWARIDVADSHATLGTQRVVLGLYRDAAAFFAAAWQLDRDHDAEIELLSSEAAWSIAVTALSEAAPGDVLPPERLTELARLMKASTFQSFERLENGELLALVTDTRRAAVSLGARIDPTLSTIRRGRAARLGGGLVLVVFAVFVALVVSSHASSDDEPGLGRDDSGLMPQARTKRNR